MAHLEKTITFLLVASFVLLLIPVISVPATSTVYFAEIKGSDGFSYLRAGMWGACSNTISLGSGSRDIRGCTSGSGAYTLRADLPATSDNRDGISPGPPEQFEVQLLRSGTTGPIICLLVSFICVALTMVPWFHDIFRPTHKRVGLDRFFCWLLILISMILAWVGFGYAGHLKSDLDTALDSYRNSGVQSQIYKTSYSNAVWCSLVGSITVTLLWALQSKRWNDLTTAKRLANKKINGSEAKDDTSAEP